MKSSPRFLTIADYNSAPFKARKPLRAAIHARFPDPVKRSVGKSRKPQAGNVSQRDKWITMKFAVVFALQHS